MRMQQQFGDALGADMGRPDLALGELVEEAAVALASGLAQDYDAAARFREAVSPWL